MSTSTTTTPGLTGCHMTEAELAFWRTLVRTSGRQTQPRGSWDLTQVTPISLATLQAASPLSPDELLEVIGRLCDPSAMLLRYAGDDTWQIGRNPNDVQVNEIKIRRTILCTASRWEQLRVMRQTCRKLANEAGQLNRNTAFRSVAKELGKAREYIGRMFRGCDHTKDSGTALGVLVTLVDDPNLELLAPESFAGCDFILVPDGKYCEALAHDREPDDYSHGLRELYHKAARTTVDKAASPTEDEAAREPTPPAAPAAVTADPPIDAPPPPAAVVEEPPPGPTVLSPREALEARQRRMTEALGVIRGEKAGKLERVAALREEACQLEAEAGALQSASIEPMETNLRTVEGQILALREIDEARAELARREEEVLRSLASE